MVCNSRCRPDKHIHTKFFIHRVLNTQGLPSYLPFFSAGCHSYFYTILFHTTRGLLQSFSTPQISIIIIISLKPAVLIIAGQYHRPGLVSSSHFKKFHFPPFTMPPSSTPRPQSSSYPKFDLAGLNAQAQGTFFYLYFYSSCLCLLPFPLSLSSCRSCPFACFGGFPRRRVLLSSVLRQKESRRTRTWMERLTRLCSPRLGYHAQA